MYANSLSELDRQHWIHPFSQWREHERAGVRLLRSGKGIYVTDDQGVEFLDAFAGLWCVNVGYGQNSIVEAAAKQMAELPYATAYFGYGCEASVRLAAKLGELAPGDCSHVFFTLGGSDAVETAIRLVRFYWNLTGSPEKRHFIALERGYHGSLTSSSGLTGLKAFHANIDEPGPLRHHIPSPYPYRHPAGPDPQAIIASSVAALRTKVAEIGPEQVAAFICEPIQGSGGVIVPPDGYLTAMREACRDLGILFIADEVITGFGRTGPLFACESESVAPDLVTVAKGLTSGYVPMGAVFLSDILYARIRDVMAEGSPFGHGLTYSGHPVAAAVALEVLRLYQEGGLLRNGAAVGDYLQTRLRSFADHPLVGDVRGRGLLAALELVQDKTSKERFAPEVQIGRRLAEAANNHQLIFRAFSDGVIGLAPALCISRGEVDNLVDRLGRVLDDVWADLSCSASNP
jgi:adenosylmethionine-8-amino-7-oxononanoate aminotransferase